ncbi:hypothetical protein LCGC14_1356410 [marine sediment metagenome]|uniref:Uncharacterized protein n=1 Tax=marine sediment metagenome TaxID=412755 RepID=A0A0F9MPU8_9ZZZZ
MIRFINLTGQILIDDPEVYFAWFDTIVSQFMSFNDSQYWNTWKEFEQDLRIYLKEKRSTLYVSEDNEWYKHREDKIIARFKRLYPPTVLFMEGYKEPEELKNHPTNSDPSSKE